MQQIAVFFENLSFGIMIDIKRMPFNSWLNEWSIIIIDGSIKHWKYTKYMNIVQYQYRWVWVVQILIYYQQLFCYFPATTIDWNPGKALVIPSLTSRKLIQWNDVSNYGKRCNYWYVVIWLTTGTRVFVLNIFSWSLRLNFFQFVCTLSHFECY